MQDVDAVEVEVWNGYLSAWTRGFAVTEVVERGYRLRRRSDGSVLPATIEADRVRRVADTRPVDDTRRAG